VGERQLRGLTDRFLAHRFSTPIEQIATNEKQIYKGIPAATFVGRRFDVGLFFMPGSPSTSELIIQAKEIVEPKGILTYIATRKGTDSEVHLTSRFASDTISEMVEFQINLLLQDLQEAAALPPDSDPPPLTEDQMFFYLSVLAGQQILVPDRLIQLSSALRLLQKERKLSPESEKLMAKALKLTPLSPP